MSKWLILVLILVWLGWHMAQPIDLTASDLGRHIKNGELILQGAKDVLYQNFYSYTHPHYPFINHHWLFGVISFVIWHSFGFPGLSLVFILTQILAFYFFFRLAQERSSFALACAFGLLSFPLLALRSEIRPEGISMLFCGLSVFLLNAFRQGRISSSYLIAGLVLVQVLWVNTHLFFIMGLILAGLYAWQAHLDGNQEQKRVYRLSMDWIAGACLLNPSGLAGALLPLNIFKGFGYAIMEEQSLWFIYKIHYPNPAYYYFLLTVLLMVVPWALLIRKNGIKPYASLLVLMLFLTIGTFKAVRLIGPYGFFWMMATPYLWHEWIKTWPKAAGERVTIILVMAGIILSTVMNFDVKKDPYFGVQAGEEVPANFFQQQGLQGPIYNNFDIGGYLIFHLAPEHKFFVDNRPEAFPNDFFKNVYIPMQVNDTVWQQMEDHYHINVIFFNRKDLTSWGHKFLFKRLDDPSWAPVFVDGTTIIFLKRNAQNAPVISRFEWHIEKINAGTNKEDFQLISPYHLVAH